MSRSKSSCRRTCVPSSFNQAKPGKLLAGLNLLLRSLEPPDPPGPCRLLPSIPRPGAGSMGRCNSKSGSRSDRGTSHRPSGTAQRICKKIWAHDRLAQPGIYRELPRPYSSRAASAAELVNEPSSRQIPRKASGRRWFESASSRPWGSRATSKTRWSRRDKSSPTTRKSAFFSASIFFLELDRSLDNNTVHPKRRACLSRSRCTCRPTAAPTNSWRSTFGR